MFAAIAQTQLPRTLTEDSRRPFDMLNIEDSSLKKLHALFFNTKGKFSAKALKDFNGRHVYPTKIGFGAVNDLRIQLEFDDTSSLYAEVKALLHEYAIIDIEFEDIEDVSLLIGGTSVQACHTDIARIHTFWSNEEVTVNK